MLANEAAPVVAAPRGLCAQLRSAIDELVNDGPPEAQIAGVGRCAIESPVYRCRVLHPSWAAAGPVYDGLLRAIEPCLTGREWASDQRTASDSRMWWRFQAVNDAVRVTLTVRGTEDASAVELSLELASEP